MKTEMKRSGSSKNKMLNYKPMAICMALLQIALQINQSSAYDEPNGSPYYDPEQRDSVAAGALAPAIKWHYDDHQDEDSNQIPVSQAHRRNSDTDLDDGLEEEDDEDRDDYARAGSSNHGSFEEPAYGESRKAAMDGDDIESFFDKHLGPQAAMAEGVADEEAEAGPTRARQARGELDPYETAASSPLSSIFQSLLSHHKRPFIITTTDESGAADQQQTTSSSAPVGSSVRNYAANQPAAYQAPIAYFAPVASSSSVAAYEGAQQVANQPEGGQVASGQQEADYGPVREIYISRRPTLVSSPAAYPGAQQGYAPSSQKLDHQSSNAYWRGAPRHYEDQADYARYPVAASYAYQREQQQVAPAADEEQTVSFGLSFGRQNEANEEPEANPEEQSAADEQPAGYEPAGYNSRQVLRHSPPARAYGYPPMLVGYARQPVQQDQAPYHGARYHKDPSESVVQPVSYGQYSATSGTAATPVAKDTKQWATRQHLLAGLDKQIKQLNNYQGRQPSATTPSLHYAQQSKGYANPQPKQNSDNDIDTYSSYHSEVDPYKSFTTTSRIVSEPVINKPSLNAGSNYNTNNNQNNARMQTNSDKNEDNSSGKGTNTKVATSNITPLHDSNNQSSQPSQSNSNNNNRNDVSNNNLLTGPVMNTDNSHRQSQVSDDRLSNKANNNNHQANLRVRRDDSDDRDNEDADDDGVWVDDDDDDESRQQSSDLNETAQKPEEEDVTHEAILNPPTVVRGTHGYEISPDDLMVYPG